jgi:hypothetical protein
MTPCLLPQLPQMCVRAHVHVAVAAAVAVASI